jgi:uncharacterized repeat protein (TIGR03806 family)
MFSSRVNGGQALALCLLIIISWTTSVSAGINVLTYHNNSARTGQNTNETVLTPANVNTNTFGKLFTQAVDGYVYAQPLVMSAVNIPGQGLHDVVYIATEHDSVYAFDADSNLGSNAVPLWQVSFINPAANITTMTSASIGCNDIVPEIGISSTPVIDPVTGTIYVEALTVEVSNNTTAFVQRLHALDITTGAEKFGGPVVIQGSVNGATFNPLTQMNQAGLLLNNGVIYIGFSSHCDIGAYYGWLFGYGAQTLSLSNLFNVTPHGYGGTIWQSGGGPAADTNGNIYFASGHGTYDGAVSQDYANSFLKLTASNGLAVATYFTPYNQASFGALDFGTGGGMLLPDEAGSAAHPHLMVGAGAGKIYLVDRDNMGGYSGGSSDSQIVQSFPVGFPQCFDTPAYFNHTLYYWGTGPVGDYLRAFTVTNGLIATNPAALSPAAIGYPGASCSVSANGTNDGIIWAVDSSAYSANGPAVLHACNATNIGLELYNSAQAAGDYASPAVKFSVPTVVNGRVYVGGQYSFTVYGSTGVQVPTVTTPAIIPSGALFTNSISITITDATPGAVIYYTLDDSTPATNSLLYSGPFSISNSLTVQAGAFLAGAINSSVASATFTSYVPTVATPVIVPNGALFTNSISITLTDAAPGAAIYYTQDGSTPATNSLLYSGPFSISNSLTVRAGAFLTGEINSSVASATFTNYMPTVATPVIIPNGALFTNSISITLTDAAPGAVIYYTQDGSTPATNSLLYSGPLSISNSLTVRAGAFLTGEINSSVASATFTKLVPTTGANVLTYHNDNARTGQNTNETVLTPFNVNTNTFGKLFTQAVDGYVYAQPLVMSGVNIPGQGLHDVVYVATEHDSVYAYDADSNTGSNTPLWQVSFINPSAGVTTLASSNIDCGDLVPEIGITSTPVIDPVSGTIYVEAKTQEMSNNVAYYMHRLHALDITTGAEKFGGPVLIQAAVPGSGSGTDGTGHVPFVGLLQMNRPGLLLNHGVVYLAYASHCDIGAFHGWVIGYNAQTLTLSNAFNVTPNGSEGGIWQSGCGPAADTNGNIFCLTGNGTFDATDYGDSFIKLSTTNGLALVSYFTPYNQQDLSDGDLDLDSGGGMLLPDSVGSVAHPHLMVGAGKEGTVYLLDRDNMGGYNSGGDSQIVQVMYGAIGTCFDTPAYFNKTIYYCGGGDYVRAFAISNGLIAITPVAVSPTWLWWPGATPSVSANGTNNGIIWVIDSGHYNDPSTGYAAILHAYNATNVALELYNTTQAAGGARDFPGAAVKFSTPTVVNGRVYVGAQYAFSVFGLTSFLATPVITPNGGIFTNSISITITDATPGVTIYYTLDGSVPTTSSILYTNPLVLTLSAAVQARAFAANAAPSGFAGASFVNVAPANTNSPPSVTLLNPTNNSTFTAAASVTLSASVTASNYLTGVSFYANGILLGSLTNSPYTITATGLSAGSYALTSVASDVSGLSGTSAPVNITVIAGSGQPYGLTNRGTASAFFNMPTTYNGPLPALLSLTGVFSNTPNMAPASGLIPYVPNTPLWSDGALKTRYFAVPNNGGIITSNEQIRFAATGSWAFPAGTVFVKTFALNTDTTNPNVTHRLETRLLVRDTNGAVYGVTYKWRADYSDADLLSNSLVENISITNATGITTQMWYYPSPADCLTCHTPVANYVLGVNTRQLNNSQTYPATGVTDNQLRTLNRLGLFNPAFNEASITNFEKLSALTNLTASLQERARSYLDANCAQCHQPGGTGPTFDGRYDTPLVNQHLTNFPATFPLGYDRAMIIKPQDIWRSMVYERMNTTNAAIKMPTLARNLIDTNGVAVMAAWINSLPGLSALAPPTITPNGGTFFAPVKVALQGPDTNAAIYFTLDGSLPTTNSFLYSQTFTLATNAIVSASAYETNYDNSVAAGALFSVFPIYFLTSGFLTNGQFQMEFNGAPGSNYVLQASTNLLNWTPLTTNLAATNLFNLMDPGATNFPLRFYRVLQQP